MKTLLSFSLFFILLSGSEIYSQNNLKPDKTLPYFDSSLSVEERIKDLLGRMTVEEKTMQLIQSSLRVDSNTNNNQKQLSKLSPLTGSYLNSSSGAAGHNQVQKQAAESTRLGIPIIFGQDVIHGVRTIYPHALTTACSFNPEMARKLARMAAKESVAMGWHWTFSPVVDVARDPRWGRGIEGYGEDPYVNGVFGVATVKGYQGDDLTAEDTIAACVKHYVGYGASEGGRDYAYTDISRRALWESHLPPFKACVDAGAATIMTSFNDITGIPAVSNHYTLTEILRNRWGFDGFVVSDWGGVQQQGKQGVTFNKAKQGKLALEAGNDMCMVGNGTYRAIPALIKSGELKESVLDEAVRRVLRIKFRLGLFERPYFKEIADEKAFLLPEYKQLAEDAASECIVLLKNKNNILPLKKVSIALIGPSAKDTACLYGSWSCLGRVKEGVNIATALEKKYEGTINYSFGCWYHSKGEKKDNDSIKAAVAAAKKSDVVVLCMGEAGDMTGENRSRSQIELPGPQEDLIDAIKATGKPIVLVLASGRPIGLEKVESKVDAIMWIGQPGMMGGNAVADLLLGNKNPSGKLAVTFPRSTGSIPMYYSMHNRARKTGGYHDIKTSPMFLFGDGLSYTTFSYSKPKVDKSNFKKNDSINATVTVTNSGKMKGKETIFWYISDLEASITQPPKRLIAFEKIELNPDESKTVSIKIDPLKDLSFPDYDGQRILEAGDFIVTVNNGNWKDQPKIKFNP
jgi:beta-glucosidase